MRMTPEEIGKAVKVGDELIVTSGAFTYRAKVVKAGPAWLTLYKIQEDGSLRDGDSWRLRRDTRTETNDPNKTYSYSPYWRTLAEHEQIERDDAAHAVLRAEGVAIEFGSTWRDRAEELARRVTMPLPRGTVEAAEVSERLDVNTHASIGPRDACAGILIVTGNYGDSSTVHLSEAQRVALIESLGGVA